MCNCSGGGGGGAEFNKEFNKAVNRFFDAQPRSICICTVNLSRGGGGGVKLRGYILGKMHMSTTVLIFANGERTRATICALG